ncbi:MAG: hypothetical protein IJV64_08560 [Oscillospiraceae bacterium]|nr:hypothetical protein [Oscillospiraceae bacterium]
MVVYLLFYFGGVLFCLSACRIIAFFAVCKFLSIDAVDGALNFQQQHTGNVAGGRAEDSHGVERIEIIQAVKVLGVKVERGVYAAARQNGVGDAAFQQTAEADFQIEVVQILQKAALADVPQLVEVVRAVGLRGDFADRYEVGGKGQRLAVRAAESVIQRLGHGVLILRAHLPQARRDGAVVAGVGVGNVKDVFQMRALAAIVDQGDTTRTAVYPPPHAVIPQFNGRAGRSVGALAVDQKLLREWVLVDAGGGQQVILPRAALRRQPHGQLLRVLYDGLQLACHSYPSLSFRLMPFLLGCLPAPTRCGALFLAGVLVVAVDIKIIIAFDRRTAEHILIMICVNAETAGF